MAIDKLNNVAIVGAGLAGLSLALFLKQHGVDCTVYDLRPARKLPYSGPLALTPNGLRAADAIGLLDRLRPLGCPAQYVTTVNNDHQLVDQREIGNADKYGYDALRIYRKDVVNVLMDMADEAGVRTVYEKKFSHVVGEDERGATIAFTDGEQRTHDLVVGADGIYSGVRKYLHPGAKPTYAGRLAVAAIAETSAIKLPSDDYPLPTSIGSAHGHVILCPNSKEDPSCPVATGTMYPEQTREGWAELENDRSKLLEILRSNYDKWNPTVQSALDAVDPETLFMWPFYTISKLPTWKSEKGRVVIFGDAAHGLPPIGALGANLAFEDAHSLGLIIAHANEGQTSWTKGLQWWHEYRRDRMDGVQQLTDALAKKRQRNAQQTSEQKEKMDDGWVFSLDVVRDVNEWLCG